MDQLAVDVAQLLSAGRVDAGVDELRGSAVAGGLEVAQQGMDRRRPRRSWPVDNPLEQVGARLLGEAYRSGKAGRTGRDLPEGRPARRRPELRTWMLLRLKKDKDVRAAARRLLPSEPVGAQR